MSTTTITLIEETPSQLRTSSDSKVSVVKLLSQQNIQTPSQTLPQPQVQPPSSKSFATGTTCETSNENEVDMEAKNTLKKQLDEIQKCMLQYSEASLVCSSLQNSQITFSFL